MRCPTISEIPPPPPGKTGWPWTEETPQLPDTIYPVECKAYSTGMPSALCPMPDAMSWPKISIVTPSYNQGQFLEETIRSVLLQGYPNLEYFIIDGGSKDKSVEIIRKFEAWLTYWISEPDRGQSNALNKGFKLTTGQIVGWLNSDDIYLPRALFNVASKFPKDKTVGAISGISVNLKDMKSRLNDKPLNSKVTLEGLICANPILQPSTFVRREMFNRVGYLREDFHFIMDYEFWVRIAMISKILRIEKKLAAIRWHSESKSYTLSHLWLKEKRDLLREYSHNQKFQDSILQAAIREGLARWWGINGQISLRERKIVKGFLCIIPSLLYKPSKIIDIRRLINVGRKFLSTFFGFDRSKSQS